MRTWPMAVGHEVGRGVNLPLLGEGGVLTHRTQSSGIVGIVTQCDTYQYGTHRMLPTSLSPFSTPDWV